MEKKHEQSIIDGFFDHFKEVAIEKGEKLTRCSSDGQDSLLGGDYIFTNNTMFVLAEFKYEESDIKTENKKARRLNLCVQLDEDSRRLQQSLQCHYIGWSTKSNGRTVEFNKYYYEVCNTSVFSKFVPLKQSAANYKERKKADKLIDDFLNGEIGASYKVFEVYIDWLLALEEDSNSGVELITRDPYSKTMKMIDFKSVYDLKVWLDYNKPAPKVSSKPAPRNPFQP
ncbi:MULTISPECIES: hypothetical protein [unclassified Vibrio]|uniref:hypothetical protein n=1 Tax=Vibrio TaxID=662 RepID=UPI00076A4A41|nr:MULTISPECIES: hypothetical protein [unclassified Vibrio]PTO89696.1 hypothetical protein CWO08_22400 [Vibrio sp. 10N.286.48.B8]